MVTFNIVVKKSSRKDIIYKDLQLLVYSIYEIFPKFIKHNALYPSLEFLKDISIKLQI